MKVAGFAFLFLLAVALIVILAGQVGLLKGREPTNLGVKDGRLKPPSPTPNSVSSQAALYPKHPQRDYAAIEPLRYTGNEAQAGNEAGLEAMKKLAAMLKDRKDITIVRAEPDYIYAVARTPLLRFADDLEFWLDTSNNVIQVRSASRLGRKDLGANRKRMEEIRAQFN